MLIKLNEIPAEGLFFKLDQTDRKMAKALKDLLADNPFQVEVHILPINRGYEVYGKILGVRTLECSFCLCEFQQPFYEKFHDLYLKNKGAHTLQISDISSDFEVFPLKSLKFSLSYFLHEILVLTTDFQVLCQKDCHGLCPDCGNNLNYEKCLCQLKKDQEIQKSNPFSVLKELQIMSTKSQNCAYKG